MTRYEYNWFTADTLDVLLVKAKREGCFGWELLSVIYNGCNYEGVLKRQFLGERSEPT